MITTGYPGIALMIPDEKEHRRQIAAMLNDRVNIGKFNCTYILTLTASSTTTTLIDSRIGAYSYLGFMAQTAHAASVHASIYVTNQIKGQATINHTSDANTDKTFTVVILG